MTEYEQIKEKIGIDLVTIYKAGINGIFFKNGQTIQSWGVYNHKEIIYINFSDNTLDLYLDNGMLEYEHFCEFSEYGKAWALSMEELEK